MQNKFTEIRYLASTPEEMRGKYLAKNVLKTWIEDFVDDDTGEVTHIERNEILYKAGELLDPDLISRIMFNIQAEEIDSILVSNQKRKGKEIERTYLYPFTVDAEIDDKKVKHLLYANDARQAIDIASDYIQLNNTGLFEVLGVKEYNRCVILTDTLKRALASIPFDEWDKVNPDEISEEDSEVKKFFETQVRLTDFEDNYFSQNFVIHSFNSDRCLTLISRYLKEKELERLNEAKEKGEEYIVRNYTLMIEKFKPIAIGCFIDYDFSLAYIECEKQGIESIEE